ncbi:hypothetical protein BdWA1_000528 [Babesia duncani]|uniref:RNase MRP protein 1 RNA binding domain-containing protein n=1 Tax=Babesia duncani TaxID=323732 RepID=A0AAD9PMY8_9APIC|nr:hypothetical protein BdWA1_000528 [Babesia duncani]
MAKRRRDTKRILTLSVGANVKVSNRTLSATTVQLLLKWLGFEHGILRLLLYRNKNQHRSCWYYRLLSSSLQRLGNFLKKYNSNLTGRKWSDLVASDKFSKCYHLALESLLRAAAAVCRILSMRHFVPLMTAILALLSRCSALLRRLPTNLN